MKRLIDKVAVVTGAGSGIGRAIAERFASEGAAVVLAGRTQSKLIEVAHQIEARRGRAHVVVCDVTREEDVALLVAEAFKRYNGVDIMVNNAGIMRGGEIVDASVEDYDRVVDTNLKGTFLGCREAFKVMKAHGGGTILNISSLAGTEAWAGIGLYAASKFGVMGLSEALADEGLPHGIRVSALCPGMVHTGATRDFGVGAADMIQVEDIADAALYLVTLPKNVDIPKLVLKRRGAE